MLRRLVCLSVLVSFQICAQADDGLTAYQEGSFAAAIPLLEAAHSKTPEDAVIEAALLSSLVSEDRLDRAAEVDADAAKFSSTPEVLTARAEFAFHMGDMPNAEQKFKSALQLKDTTARVLFGLSRLYRAASFYR
jgi:Flp pilus assembly protein TadD